MADSFADLWQSSAPTAKPQTLSSLNSKSTSTSTSTSTSSSNAHTHTHTQRKTPDVFALLASKSNTTPSSSSSSAYTNSYRPQQAPAQPISRTTTASPASFSSSSTAYLTSYSYSLPASRPASAQPPPAHAHAPSILPLPSPLPSVSISTSGSAATKNANTAPRFGDAFGDLFTPASGVGGVGVNASANMTLAARAKMEQEQRQGQIRQQQGSSASGLDAWAGLDALGAGAGVGAGAGPGGPAAASIRPPVPAVRVDHADEDDWGLGDFGTTAAASSKSKTTSTSAPGRQVHRTEIETRGDGDDAEDADEDDWGLGDFGYVSRGGSGSASTPTPPLMSMSAPQDEDDILGVLSRPVQDVRAARAGTSISPSPSSPSPSPPAPAPRLPPRTSSTNSSTSASAPSATSATTSTSTTPTTTTTTSTKTTAASSRDPPPHILGQIVEMGFSVAQARGALLASSSSSSSSASGSGSGQREWDVQAALEMLLSQSQGPSPAAASRAGTPQQPPSRNAFQQEVQQAAERTPGAGVGVGGGAAEASGRAPPKGRRERDLERQERQERLARLEREISASASSSSGARAESSTSTVVPAELAHHAERVLEMGKEVGRGVLGRASAFWREGRERVEKVLVEREESKAGQGRGAGAGRGAGRGGVPRWMQERPADGDGDDQDQEHGLGGYADAHGDDDEREGEDFRGPALRERTEREAGRGGGDDAGVDLFNVDDDDGGRVQETTATARVTKVEREVEEVDLFSMPVPARPAAAEGSGPSRHTSSASSQARQTGGSSSSAYRIRPSARGPASASTSTSAPTPKLTTKRTLIAASSGAITQAATHRATGTAAFKLGQYADAAAAYSRALDALPAGHLLRVPLLTNRALALMRIGECKGAERDCAEAARVIVGGLPNNASGAGGAFDPSDERLDGDINVETERLVDAWTPAQESADLVEAGRAKANDAGWADTQRYEGVGVDLVDGYVKARRRRAEALEMQEKWRAAAKDWEVLAAAPWVPEKVRGEARSGVGRCRRMLGEDAVGAAPGVGPSAGSGAAASVTASTKPKAPPAASKPKPRAAVKSTPQVSSRTGTPTGAALKALQTSTAQAEAEDTLRHTLKDGVDARLAAWRGGKETNIRALLASLDTVLWPEILAGGVQVSGLGALITPAQVKKGYVKAIARVHPDKLNPSNPTVEQRMLANGVFGTLNEAWIAFQAGAK